jgi:transcriptional regulator with XRE-family HTH domain
VNNLKLWRQAKGLNQRQLAEIIHGYPSAISNIEKGHVRAWPKIIKDLSEALDVDEKELFPEGW